MTARTHVRYGLLTVLYVAGLYWLSSLPDLSPWRLHPVMLVLSNLSHAPAFALLAYGVLKTLTGPRPASREQYAAAFAITSLLAVLDEWHQSFVPGRSASAGDLLLDLAGIVALLVIVRLRAVSSSSHCEAK
jgi:VanZ family protein